MRTSPAPDDYLADLKTALAGEPAIAAAWLGGSYGRGTADRWSDIDLHVLLAADDFRGRVEPWLNTVRPLVLFKLLFDGRMVNALTADGLRIDIWFYREPPDLDPTATAVLFDRGDHLHFAPPAAPPAPAPETAAALRSQIEEFWRCIALLPTVVGRHEYIVAFQGLNVELNLLLDILLRGSSVVRESGVKRLNRYLPESLQAEIEAALTLDGPTAEALVRAHLALADILRVHGRMLAQSWDFSYPFDLEAAVLRYVADELGLLGLTSSPPGAPAH